MKRIFSFVSGISLLVLLGFPSFSIKPGRFPVGPALPGLADEKRDLSIPDTASNSWADQGPDAPFSWAGAEQLPYIHMRAAEVGPSPEAQVSVPEPISGRAINGRRIPQITLLSQMRETDLRDRSVPLPEANTLIHVYQEKGKFGQLRAADGSTHLFVPETVLVKVRGSSHVAALRVEEMRELEALRVLGQRNDVEFAELDLILERQFIPNDPQITNQWHHATIGSSNAWEKSVGSALVRMAIVDTPFQMDHPDLVGNAVSGWDLTINKPVTASTGIVHSTVCAGTAAAVINNRLGVAGAGNCQVLPINIIGSIAEMYDATIWAADHGVRVVNISWDGAYSDSLNLAGLYLKNKIKGVLVMAGVNGNRFLNYTNQPNILAISMTDGADNVRSAHGNHIDFAAPGWDIFSTTTNAGYATDSGSSYSTSLFCGIVGVLLSINPGLGPDEVEMILKSTAADKGQAGWDPYYGWGRVDFGKAAAEAARTLPQIVISQARWTASGFAVSANFLPGSICTLWRSDRLEPFSWVRINGATASMERETITLTDPEPANRQAFYRIEGRLE
ncbi:MAG: S8 family serine peptidase [Chloroflexi bacterium]|nr:S8 family serine peptidase [Chloroflexota bacterium]